MRGDLVDRVVDDEESPHDGFARPDLHRDDDEPVTSQPVRVGTIP